MLKTRLIERIRDFYSNGFCDGQPIIDEAYKTKVLAKSKTTLGASVVWMIESQAFDPDDAKVIEKLTLVRNSLAHDLPGFLTMPEKHDLFVAIKDTQRLLHKVEHWWFVNFELEVNPLYDELDKDSIDVENVVGGTSIMLQMLEKVALADEKDASVYLSMWHEMKKEKK